MKLEHKTRERVTTYPETAYFDEEAGFELDDTTPIELNERDCRSGLWCKRLVTLLVAAVFFCGSIYASDPPSNGLLLRLKADVGVSLDLAGGVSTWSDQSGLGNNATQVTGANRPTVLANALNGYPAIHFTGSSAQYFNLPNFLNGASATAAEVLVVLRSTVTSGTNNGLWYFGTNPYDWYPLNSGAVYESFGSNAQKPEDLPILNISQFHVYDVSSATGAWKSRLDGLTMCQTSTSTVAFNTTPYLGLNGSGNGFYGDIAEILVYDHVLSDSDRFAASAYLAGRYGIINSPAAPTIAAAAKTSATQAVVSWTNAALPNTPTTYIVERQNGPGNGFNPVAEISDATSFIDVGLTPGISCQYRVYAQNWVGNSGYSNTVTAVETSTGAGNFPTASLRMWMMADSAQISPLTLWGDFSGNGNDGFQTTYTQRPTVALNTLNGKPVLHFTGSSTQFYRLPNFLGSATAGEIITVLRAGTTSGTNSGLWYFGTNPYDWYPFNNGVTYNSFGSNAQQTEGQPTLPLNQFHIYDVSSQTGYWESRLDGVPLQASITNTVAFTTTPYLGMNGAGGGFYGDIAECLVYDRVLTDSERYAIGTYLSQKYALGTAPSTPTGLTVTAVSSTQNLLSWNGPSGGGLIQYIVERATTSGGPYTQIAVVVGVGSYSDSTAVAGQQYFYRVTAQNTAGASAASTEAAITTLGGATLPVSGLRLWLLGDGTWESPLGYWHDYSGYGNDAFQTIAGSRPTVTGNAVNGKPAVHFVGGSAQYFTLPNFLSGATSAEAVVVIRATSKAANSGFWRFGTSAGDYFQNGNGNVYDGFGSTTRYLEGGLSQDITQFHVYQVSSQAGLWQSWVDGVPFYRSITNSVAFSTAPLLGLNNDGYGFSGDIAEIAVYNRALSDTERNSALAYLSQKYSIISAPVAPTGLAVTQLDATDNLLSWNWTPTSSAASFVVERKTGLGGTYGAIATVNGTGTYNDNNVVTGEDYYYRVYAVNPTGVSGYSAEVEVSRPMAEGGALVQSGLQLWLMADGVAESPVGFWKDYSGNGNDAWQGSLPNRPTLTTNALNGKSVVHFTGSAAQYVTLPNFLSGSTAGEALVVLRATSTTINSGLWRFGTSAGDYYQNANGNVYDGFGSNARYLESRPSQDITQYHIYNVTSQAGLWQSWIDGVPLYQSKTNTVAFSSVPLIGANNDGIAFSGDIAEILVYNRGLTDSERQSAQAYLSAKYGLFGAPATPTGLTANAFGGHTALLSWNTPATNSDIDFEVWRRELGGEWGYRGDVQGTGTYFDEGLDDETSYEYEIVAVNASGRSAFTAAVALNRKAATTAAFPTSGMKLWYMADGALESPVGHWKDYSGNGNDAWQTNYAIRPTLVANALNGKPVVHFTGSAAQYFGLPNFLTGSSAAEALIVLRATSTTTNSGLWRFGTSAGDYYQNSNGNVYDGFASTSRYLEGSPLQDITKYHVYDVTSQAGLWQSWLDTRTLFKSTTNTVGFSAVPLLGGNNDGVNFSGDIAEIVVYNRALTDEERDALRQYFAIKYYLADFDPDKDGLTTGQELALGADPLNPDTNGDGLFDGISVALGINPVLPYTLYPNPAGAPPPNPPASAPGTMTITLTSPVGVVLQP